MRCDDVRVARLRESRAHCTLYPRRPRDRSFYCIYIHDARASTLDLLINALKCNTVIIAMYEVKNRRASGEGMCLVRCGGKVHKVSSSAPCAPARSKLSFTGMGFVLVRRRRFPFLFRPLFLLLLRRLLFAPLRWLKACRRTFRRQGHAHGHCYPANNLWRIATK